MHSGVLYVMCTVLYTEGEDFNQLNTELEFDSVMLEHCVDVVIRDDTVVENTESFFMSVSSTDPVDFTSPSVTVFISDNQDSMLL